MTTAKNLAPPKFSTTSCSQCGGEFGPGNSGFSHCSEHLKATIKAHRAASGLTQSAYGALVGAKLRTVQDWESGARNMPAAKWELLQLKCPPRQHQ